MIIKKIETRIIDIDASAWYKGKPLPPGENAIWPFPLLTLETDDGIAGYSMAYGKQNEARAIVALIEDFLAPRLLGQRIDDWPTNGWPALKMKMRDLRNVTEAFVGMVDVAIWDILGKAAGKSVSQLLGVQRQRVPGYQTSTRFFDGLAGFAEEARAVQAAGYHGYKLHIWAGPKQDIPVLETVRAAVGPDFPLMLDATSRYSFADALEVGRALDRLNFTWYEEPMHDDHVAGLRELTKQLKTPLLCAESVDLDRIPNYLDRSICAMVRGDCHIKAGITGLAKAMKLAQDKGFNLEIHAAATPLLDIGNLHVAAAFTNSRFIEVFPLYFPIFKYNPYQIDREGYLTVPEGPGLGVDLDFDWIDNGTKKLVKFAH
jgi:L-alanine-DL-glutamate epimerase-like enolase superfamily enzyme